MWIQNNLGGSGPEIFEINGAIWCVLGPPESFLDQQNPFILAEKMEMNSFLLKTKLFLSK